MGTFRTIKAMLYCAVAGTANPMPSYASSAGSVMGNLIDQLVKIFPMAGVVFALVGVFNFFIAMKNDNPEKKNSAVMELLIAVVLIGFKAIWDGLGLKQYLG